MATPGAKVNVAHRARLDRSESRGRKVSVVIPDLLGHLVSREPGDKMATKDSAGLQDNQEAGASLGYRENKVNKDNQVHGVPQAR